MENFEFEDKYNPWEVQNLEQFHYYCCPECDFRNLDKSVFIKHACMDHPRSHDVIDKLEGKKQCIKTEAKPDEVLQEIDEKTNGTKTSDCQKEAELAVNEIPAEQSQQRKTRRGTRGRKKSKTEAAKKKQLESFNQEGIMPMNDENIEGSQKVGQDKVKPIHTEARKQAYKCNQCQFSCNYVTGLKVHIERVHQCQCFHCGKTFSNQLSLRQHVREQHYWLVFNPNMPYDCKRCGRTFATKNYMKNHFFRTHYGRMQPYGMQCF